MQSFDAMMQEWLYGAKGYYRSAKIGMHGDFYTSVNASKFFGGTLAFYLLHLLESGRLCLPLSIVEIGAGNGRLLGDVVCFLRDLSQGVLEHTCFVSVEPLSELAALQKTHLKKMGVDLLCLESPLNLKPYLKTSAFVYCNELWDSFACQVCQNSQMLYIDSFKPVYKSLTKRIANFLLRTLEPKEIAGFKGCVPLSWERYIQDLSQSLQQSQRWVLISFDYGQYGKRGRIDLRGYQNHRVLNFDDILANLKNCYQKIDLTYDVDFELLEALFQTQGAHTLFYGTQSAALVKMGLIQLLELFEKHTPFALYSREALKARALISPEGFGERFKGLVVGV